MNKFKTIQKPDSCESIAIEAIENGARVLGLGEVKLARNSA